MAAGSGHRSWHLKWWHWVGSSRNWWWHLCLIYWPMTMVHKPSIYIQPDTYTRTLSSSRGHSCPGLPGTVLGCTFPRAYWTPRVCYPRTSPQYSWSRGWTIIGMLKSVLCSVETTYSNVVYRTRTRQICPFQRYSIQGPLQRYGWEDVVCITSSCTNLNPLCTPGILWQCRIVQHCLLMKSMY